MSVKLLLIIIGAVVTAWKSILEAKTAHKEQRRSQIILAVLAFLVFLVLAIITVCEEQDTQAEQKAANILIQRQTSTLNRLGVEFVMRDVPDTLQVTSVIHMRTWVFLESFPDFHDRPANLETYTFFHFSGSNVLDSITPPRIVGEHNTEVVQSVDSDTIRVWFYVYGLERKGSMPWKPNTVADLQHLNIELLVTQDILMNNEIFTGRVELCPVEEIRIYSNEFSPSNLLVRTKLVTNWNRLGSTNFFGYFPVEAEMGVDSSDYLFQLKQEWQYNSILNELKSK